MCFPSVAGEELHLHPARIARRRLHPQVFEARFLEDAPVGQREGPEEAVPFARELLAVDEGPGDGLVGFRLLHELPDGFAGDLGRHLSGRVAAHAVRHGDEAHGGVEDEGVLVVLADPALVGEAAGGHAGDHQLAALTR